MSTWTILQGDALTMLQTLPSGSVQCVVTSPPYYGLRDYQVEGQMGLEDRPDCAGWATGQPCGACYICRMTEVFREVRRVLRDDGVLWLNMGDSYMGASSEHKEGSWGDSSKIAEKTQAGVVKNGRGTRTRSHRAGGWKPKDLLGMPWRLALALQADGWYLRADIIWHKKAPMPESVKDRPTRAHEFVFLLAKSEQYFYDGEAVRQLANTDWKNKGGSILNATGWATAAGRNDDWGREPSGWNGSKFDKGKTKEAREHLSPVGTGEREERPGRNLRDVWSLGPAPYPGAHFATFPPALPELCIKAGTSWAGCCPACGAPYQRQIEHTIVPIYKTTKNFIVDERDLNADPNDQGSNRQKDGHKNGWVSANSTLGWQPTCTCDAGDPIPCTVLDPFSGAGTTGLVARQLLRHYIGIELNPAYVEMSEQRLAAVGAVNRRLFE